MLHVAWREFSTTVFTKAFILGVFLPPVLIVGVLAIMPLLMNQKSPRISGHIALLDETGRVAPLLEGAFDDERVGERLKEQTQKAIEQMPGGEAAKKMMEQSGPMAAAAMTQSRPRLSVRTLPEGADIEKEKEPLLDAQTKSKEPNPDTRLALAVIPRAAVSPGEGENYDRYELFVAPKLDIEVQQDIHGQLRRAIVDARLAASGLDPAVVRRMTDVPRVQAKSVTRTGERKFNEAAQILIPGAFMFLLWIASFTCGQYLLTTTIEEKSSRVMEVLLSAVSPMQLLTGKIVGQMMVGLVVLVVYCGLGVGTLFALAMGDIIPLANVVYLLVYFLIAFFFIGSMMAAVGSAVSDMREAQSLLAPIMIVLIIPMMLWFPILRNPNSIFAQVCSFLPPISPFVMILRLSGSEPVPTWQIPASIALGVVGVIASLWLAAKIFRVGVLMYGKPPDFKTLIRWIRMA